MKNLFSILLSVAALGVSVFALTHIPTQSFGATSNAGANALYEQSLAQPLGTADVSMFVTSGADVQGNLLPVNSYQCLSVDTGQPNFEGICGTVTASSASGLTLLVSIRGLSTQTATTSNAAFVFTHRRGADVRITDFPALTVTNNQLNGVQSIPNPIFYTYNFSSAFWAGAASSTLATLGIVNDTAASGCGLANSTAKGCVQLATARQAASSTVTGSTGANDVLWSSYATDTPQNCSTPANGGCVVMSLLNAKLSQAWLDLTQSFNFSGGLTASATTTLTCSNINSNACILHGLSYTYPSSRLASSTVLMPDAIGNLTWEYPNGYNFYENTTQNSFTGSTATTTAATITIPIGTFVNGTRLQFLIVPDTSGAAAANENFDIQCGTGAASTTIAAYNNGGSGSFVDITATLQATSTASEFSYQSPPSDGSTVFKGIGGKLLPYSNAAVMYCAVRYAVTNSSDTVRIDYIVARLWQ
jgi:hypothetical protein